MPKDYHALPIEAFNKRPHTNTGIIIEDANGKSKYLFPKTKDLKELKHIGIYIAKHIGFDFELSTKELDLLAKYLGNNSRAWQILLDRYDNEQSNALFIKLFRSEVYRPLPDLSGAGTDRKKLAEVYARLYNPTALLASRNEVFRRLGFNKSETLGLLAHANLYSWVNRNRRGNIPESISITERNIKLFFENYESFDSEDKLLFLKNAGLILLNNTSYKTISRTKLKSTYELFGEVIKRIDDLCDEPNGLPIAGIFQEFDLALSTISEQFGNDHKRSELLSQFKETLTL